MKKRMNNDLKTPKKKYFALKAFRPAVLVVGLLCIGYVMISCSSPPDAPVSTTTPYEPLPANSEQSSTDEIKSLTNSMEDSPELAKFTHTNQYHAQLSCLICHRRDTNSARLELPGGNGHSPCIGCHTQQFENKNSSICTICHTDTEKGSIKSFPPLRSFNVRFDHAKHTKKTSCATCHKPTRRGVAKSIPSGARAHASCFQCHSSKAAHNMSSCSLCHQPGRKGRAISESAKAYSVSFSHAKHKLACTNCHKVLRGGSRGRQVTAPLASMHFAPRNRQSCATCHNNKRAFGGDDFADCKRCHQGNSFKFR
jgi:c(7)-type cytochrome triheme protein